jgi:hypothetical protein
VESGGVRRLVDEVCNRCTRSWLRMACRLAGVPLRRRPAAVVGVRDDGETALSKAHRLRVAIVHPESDPALAGGVSCPVPYSKRRGHLRPRRCGQE